MAVPIDNNVAGRLALITGASGGIGGACAHALAALGINLALHYSASKDKCALLADSLHQEHPNLKVSIHSADLASAQETVRLCHEASTHHGQPVLILVANAGVSRKKPHINDITLDDFDATIAVNLRAPFVLCKTLVPAMQAARFGRIVTVGSISGYGAGVNGAHYAASKAGLQGLVRNLATRLGKDGISVNDVAPAMIAGTGMIPDEKAVPGVREMIPVGRLGSTAEVGAAVAMFVGNGYVTGQSLVVAGGLPHL